MKKQNVPLIMGANGRKLYGLCSGCFPKKTRWIIEDGEEAYAKLIKEYQSETNEEKKIKKLLDLTYLSEFNEQQCGNRLPDTMEPEEKRKHYTSYNRNQTDALNRAFEPLPKEHGSYNVEDGLIKVLDVMSALKKAEKKKKPKKTP